MIQDHNGNHEFAALHCLHAAWILDDAGDDSWARECRTRAISGFRRARDHGQSFQEDPGGEEALLADLLRRTGEFQKTVDICENGLSKDPAEIIRKVLRFQQELAQNRDSGRYTIADAAPA